MSLTETTTCGYDGWNLIAERVTPGSGAETVTRYVWGLDLSQRLQGAGGIGGLLMQENNTTGQTETRLYTYEANGNVGQLVDGTTGAVVAHYEYDPFGTTLTASGTAAAANPFRFSTKYTDDDTNLVYYGYRFYSPYLGRWLTRDPIGEEGGTNVYSFVSNNPINQLDALGMASFSQVMKGGLFYTWDLGWIDKTHAGLDGMINKTLREAWEKIEKAPAGRSVTVDLVMNQGKPLLRGIARRYCIKVGRTSKKKKGQLLFAWKEISELFEGLQDAFPQNWPPANIALDILKLEVGNTSSGFSTEDYISNLVQFYSVVENTKPKILIDNYGGKFKDSDADEKIISEAIWLFSLPPGPNQAQWTPTYFNHEEFLEFDKYKFYPYIEFGIKAQKLIKKYWERYGTPQFPPYFTQYKEESEGVTILDEATWSKVKFW